MSLQRSFLADDGGCSARAQRESAREETSGPAEGPNKYWAHLCWSMPCVVAERDTQRQTTIRSPPFAAVSSVFSSPSSFQLQQPRPGRKTERISFLGRERGRLPLAARHHSHKGPDALGFTAGTAVADFCDDVGWGAREFSVSPVMPNREDDGEDFDAVLVVAKRGASEKERGRHLRLSNVGAQCSQGLAMSRFCRSNVVGSDDSGGVNTGSANRGEGSAAGTNGAIDDEKERLPENVGVQQSEGSSAQSSNLHAGNTALKFTPNDFSIARMMAMMLMEEEEKKRRYKMRGKST